MSTSGQLTKMQAGTYGAGGEKLDYSYYDSYTLSSATLVYRFFTIPLGQANKTLDRTNMITAGQLPQGQHFTIHAIKVLLTSYEPIDGAGVQSYYNFITKTTLEFVIPGKDTLGTWTLQEVLGMSSNISVLPAVPGDFEDINRPRYHGVFPLNTPIVLAALTPFEVRATHHTAVAEALDGVKFMISLNGKLVRAS